MLKVAKRGWERNSEQTKITFLLLNKSATCGSRRTTADKKQISCASPFRKPANCSFSIYVYGGLRRCCCRCCNLELVSVTLPNDLMHRDGTGIDLSSGAFIQVQRQSGNLCVRPLPLCQYQRLLQLQEPRTLRDPEQSRQQDGKFPVLLWKRGHAVQVVILNKL